MVVEEGWRIAGFGAEIADRVQRECFDDLDAPVIRVTAADVPMPYAKTLEKAYLPQPEKVVDAGQAGPLPLGKTAMAVTKVVLAKLSPTMEEGTIVKWNKNEGDAGQGRATCWPRSRPTRPTWRWRRWAPACCARSWCRPAARRPSAALIGVIAEPNEDISAAAGHGGAAAARRPPRRRAAGAAPQPAPAPAAAPAAPPARSRRAAAARGAGRRLAAGAGRTAAAAPAPRRPRAAARAALRAATAAAKAAA